MTKTRKQNPAFTLVELIVVIAIVATLAACLAPALARTRYQVARLACSNNLKQVAVAFRTWATAHGGNPPTMVAGSYGGASEDVDVNARTVAASQALSHGACKIFLACSNELVTPKTLFCPAEYETSIRQSATTFAGTVTPGTNGVPYTNDMNVSYFVGVDASDYNPRMPLTGDHNLGGNGNPPTVAFGSAPTMGTFKVALGTNSTANQGPAFMDNMHSKQGNVGMADGSVEWFNRTNLQAALKNSGDRYHASHTAYTMATGAMGPQCNCILLP
jgi:prepilin-type N-terminal cleavage/methylation domain-containing protein/prepilin-type processing-associated H-X9-DG protein